MKKKVYSGVFTVLSLFGIGASGVAYVASSNPNAVIQAKAADVEYVNKDVVAFKDVVYSSWATFVLDGETDYGTAQATKDDAVMKSLNLWNNVYCNNDTNLKLYSGVNSAAIFNIAGNIGGTSGAVNTSICENNVLAQSIRRVTVPAGTEFPSLGYAEKSGNVVYRTTVDKTFVRTGSGWVLEPNIDANEVANYFAVEGSWNPGAHPTFPNMNTYAVRFSGVTSGTSFTFGGSADNLDVSVDVGSNITINGQSFYNAGCKVHYAFGSFYLGLSINPAALTQEYNIIEIKQDTVFQFHKLNAARLVVEKTTGKMYSLTAATGINWNNQDYGSFASTEGVDTLVNAVPQNGYLALVKFDKTVNGNTSASDQGYINLKDSTVTNLLDHVFVNGKLLSSSSKSIIATYAGMLYLYVPSEFGYRPYIEITEGGYIGKDTTGNIYLDHTQLLADGVIGGFGMWKLTNAPKTISDITYTAITWNNISYIDEYKDAEGNFKKGLLISFSGNLSSNRSLADGVMKNYNLAPMADLGSKVKLNGKAFNEIENAELKYFSTNLLWMYVPGMGTKDNVLELSGLTIDDAKTDTVYFKFDTKWAEATKIVFDSNGGSDLDPYFGKTNSEKLADIGSLFTPTKSGYRFDGWSLNGSEIPADAVCEGLSQTLVANWVEQRTVTFVTATGNNDVSVDLGGKVARPQTDPTKENAHFDDWYTDNTYSVKFDFANTVINVNTSIYAKFIDCVDGEIVYSEPTADHKITATLYCGIDKDEVLATETATGSYSQDSAATCVDGETGHYTYTFTNTKFATQTENVVLDNALGHDYGDPVVTWEGKTATATMTCSHDDSHKITETKDGTFVEDTPATCTSKNLGHYEVTFDNTDLGSARTDANSVEGDVPATGHKWSVKVTWDGKFAEANATCEHTGCQETLYEKKEATYVKDTDATCHSYETGHYEVTFDNTELGSAQTDANSVINTDAEKPSHIYGDPDYDWTAIDGGFECVAIQECENSGCDEVKTEIGVVTSKVTKEPSCTEKGERTYTATFETIETATKVVEIPALGHDVETIDGEPATCKEDGYKEAYYCNNCKAYYEDEDCENLIGDLEALEAWRLADGKLAKENVPHTPADAVNENVVAPTCTEAGSHDEVVYCSVCGEEISRTPVTDPALGHDMSPVAGKAATCKEDGYKAAYFCETCEKYFEDEAGANLIGDATAYAAWKLGEGKLAKEDVQHTPAEAVRENIVEPTCTEAGSYDEVVYCSVCGEELSRTKIDLPATGHVWGEGEVTKPATCTENGVKTFTCECGETKTEVIPATGHKLGELIPEVAATTEKEGMKAHYVCSECGQLFDANKMACTAESLVIPKLEPQPEPKKGCGGSVITASAVVTGLAIAGAALIAAKKKED